MLNAHFTCGDGRCNENIALSARSTRSSTHEHDRLVDYIKQRADQRHNAALASRAYQWQSDCCRPGYG